jgi:GAF domain-containing protein
VDAFLEAAPVSSSDLAAEPRWPDFRLLALAAGIRAWLSVPVHQHHGPIGALDFARTDPRPWRRHDLAAADAHAQLLMATLRQATAQQEERLSPPLQFAVQHDTRIEQARDVIMQRERLDQAAAVELLRLQAQIEGQPIRAVASPAPDADRYPRAARLLPRWPQPDSNDRHGLAIGADRDVAGALGCR